MFDNGDSSPTGGMTMLLATANASTAAGHVDDLEAAIERFRNILANKLKYARDFAGELTVGDSGPTHIYFDRYLGSDYGPGRQLSEAADEAGVPKNLFSWKSDVYIDDDHVAAKFGYGAAPVYHYPMPDGSWLVCALSGPDISKIKAAVADGRLPELALERPCS